LFYAQPCSSFERALIETKQELMRQDLKCLGIDR
jgi:hypothetical protein